MIFGAILFILKVIIGITYIVGASLLSAIMLDMVYSDDHKVLTFIGSVTRIGVWFVPAGLLLSFIFPFDTDSYLSLSFASTNIILYTMIVLLSIRVYIAQVREDLKR